MEYKYNDILSNILDIEICSISTFFIIQTFLFDTF